MIGIALAREHGMPVIEADAWALLLFCCAMSTQLSLTLGTDFLAWGWPRLAFNAPLVGATTFHLFTSYPIEPDWVSCTIWHAPSWCAQAQG